MDSPIDVDVEQVVDVEKAIEFYRRTKANQKRAMAKYRKNHPEIIKVINKRYYEKRKKMRL